jgi:hypothetical protein
MAFALAACAPPKPNERAAIEALPACKGTGAAQPEEKCKMDVGGRTARVEFGILQADGKSLGSVNIDVLGAKDDTLSPISQLNVETNLYPRAEDFDKDGRVDILIPVEQGNANTRHTVWLQKADGAFNFAGEIGGVSHDKMPSGLIAVPARSSAAEWNVAFYRVDDAKLTPIATVASTAQMSGDGKALKSTTCELIEQPGIASMNLDAAAAEKTFCADPSVTILFAE